MIRATIVFLLLWACSAFGQDGQEAQALSRDQEASLQRLGLTATRVKTRGVESPVRPYTKITAVDNEGVSTDLALDSRGNILNEVALGTLEMSQAAARKELFGAIDEEGRGVLDRLADADAVAIELHPLFQAPEPPIPPDETVPISPDDAELLMLAAAEYREQMAVARLQAATELREETQAIADSLGEPILFKDDHEASRRHVTVEGSKALIEVLIRIHSVAGGVLSPELLPPPVGGAAAANDYINMDVLRTGPGTWDGDGNGDKIRLGFVETGTGPYAWPLKPPGWASWSFHNSSPSCSVDTDCGSCGSSPGNFANGCQCINSACIDNHGTLILSVLASSDGGDEIGARGSRIYYDNDSSFSSSISWLASQDVHIMSLSQIGPSQLDRDEAVRDDDMALFNLAGNHNPPTTTCASPNVICVGNWDYANNAINATSNYVNFSGIDREQPDLIAPGTSLRLYTPSSTWTNGWNGTSFAAPMAASVAALLHDVSKTSGGSNQYYPTWELYPEATKALMMTSATFNLPGTAEISLEGSPDEKDGAGAIDVESVERVFNDGHWSIQYRTTADAQSHLLKSVSLTAGQKIRTFLAWSRCPSSTTSDLSADLDLRIKDPGGNWVAYGDSYDQTYEGIVYTAPSTGTYGLYVLRWYMNSCNGTTGEIVGLSYDIQ